MNTDQIAAEAADEIWSKFWDIDHDRNKTEISSIVKTAIEKALDAYIASGVAEQKIANRVAHASEREKWTVRANLIVDSSDNIIGEAVTYSEAKKITDAYNATLQQSDDTKRLDWLEALDIFNHPIWVRLSRTLNVRETIDAAMSQTKET